MKNIAEKYEKNECAKVEDEVITELTEFIQTGSFSECMAAYSQLMRFPLEKRLEKSDSLIDKVREYMKIYYKPL